MTETEYIQNLRLALDETNRWFRHIDNFYWALSSFLMLATSIAVAKALEWNGKNQSVLIFGVIMIAIWILFLLFTRNSNSKVKFYLKRINHFEQKLKIEVLPERVDEIKGGISFGTIMIIVAYSSCLIWCAFIIEYIYKYCHYLHHCHVIVNNIKF